MLYDVTALFGEPVNGHMSRSASETDERMVSAESMEAAARKWLWKLSEAEREATLGLIVGPVTDGRHRPYPVYRGESVEFIRVGGRLERRA